jgi:hypothetical protein
VNALTRREVVAGAGAAAASVALPAANPWPTRMSDIWPVHYCEPGDVVDYKWDDRATGRRYIQAVRVISVRWADDAVDALGRQWQLPGWSFEYEGCGPRRRVR